MHLTNLVKTREGAHGCNICGGVGFYLEEIVSGSRSGEILVCSCIAESCETCLSKSKAPYMEFDESLNKMVPCVCHKARLQLQRLESLYKSSNVPTRYKYKFFQSLDTDELSFLAAFDWASTLVNDWQDKQGHIKGMYLYGGTGAGKTLLACSIINELMFRYQAKCRYAKISKDFLNALRDTYQKDSDFHGQERTIEQEFADVDVLVIDDFGVQKDSDWANAKLYDLIDTRYEKNKLTLLTSNSPLSDWKEKGEGRIYSRLYEMTREIHLECPDYRLKHHV